MKPLAGALVFIAFAIVVRAEEGRPDYPDCYCTDRAGKRVELGDSICLVVDGRTFLARCEMSLNNPIWRELSDGCLTSGLKERGMLPSSPAAFLEPAT